MNQILARYLAERDGDNFYRWLRENHHRLEFSDGTIYPPPKHKQPNKVLWIINVCWLGGSTLWALDAIRSMPRWNHYVIYLNGEEDHSVAERFRQAGADLSKVIILTRESVEAINPSIIMLSNSDPSRIEGEFPFSWLMDNYPCIYIHHSPVHPWIPNAIADVFVSKHLHSMYNNILDRMKKVFIVPPGIVAGEFAFISRDYTDRCNIGRVTNDDPNKFPIELINIVSNLDRKVEVHIVGGAKYYKNVANESIHFPDFGLSVRSFLSNIDIFIYRTNLTETWCRAISEAMASGLPCVAENRGGPSEQITHGVDGFLCNSDEEFIQHIRVLIDSPDLRKRMGMAAREKAVNNFGIDKFVSQVEPIMIDNVLSV